MTPICVNVKQAAALIGISAPVIRTWIADGLLPVIKFPSQRHADEKSRRVLIAVSDLEAFVAKYRSGSLSDL
jgi:predicted site-specific integrase-resolvase